MGETRFEGLECAVGAGHMVDSQRLIAAVDYRIVAWQRTPSAASEEQGRLARLEVLVRLRNGKLAPPGKPLTLRMADGRVLSVTATRAPAEGWNELRADSSPFVAEP
jgi:hypothetical protein